MSSAAHRQLSAVALSVKMDTAGVPAPDAAQIYSPWPPDSGLAVAQACHAAPARHANRVSSKASCSHAALDRPDLATSGLARWSGLLWAPAARCGRQIIPPYHSMSMPQCPLLSSEPL